MSVIELFEEDFSSEGMAKMKALLAEAYPEDGDMIVQSRIEWPRPMMVIEEAVWKGVTIKLHYSGDEVTREPRDG